jgi:hypothetical protein
MTPVDDPSHQERRPRRRVVIWDAPCVIWDDPGEQREPWIESLESVLRVVETDVRAAGLDGSVRLVRVGPELHVVFRGGGSAGTHGIEPGEVDDSVGALVAVATDLQSSVMHGLRATVWPVCPAHDLCAHAQEHEGAAVWWCSHSGGHVIAAIGRWGSR